MTVQELKEYKMQIINSDMALQTQQVLKDMLKAWSEKLMLEEERNKKQGFIRMYNTFIDRPGAAGLFEYLQDGGFFEAPASTQYHGSYKGGLVDHSFDVMVNMMKGAAVHQYSMESCAIVSLLHDVCKMDCYKEIVEDGKITYKYEDDFPAGHGEKSIFIIQKFMPLTEEEILAIRWHMGGFDHAVRGGCRDINKAYQSCKLAVLLHLADMEATYIKKTPETKCLVSGAKN